MKGYRAIFNHVFALAGTDLANRIISRMFSSFEKNCLLRVIKPPEWDLPLVPSSFTHLLFEPLKLSLDKHMT